MAGSWLDRRPADGLRWGMVPSKDDRTSVSAGEEDSGGENLLDSVRRPVKGSSEPAPSIARRSSLVEVARPAEDTGRFVERAVVGRGGMGIVIRAFDKQLCRDVAVKYLDQNADTAQVARFIEEAKITG